MNLKKLFFLIFLFNILILRINNSKNYSPFLAKKNRPQIFNKRINPYLPLIFLEEPVITDIVINGLINIPIEVIYGKLPLRTGDIADPKKIAAITKNIFSTGYFTDVKIYYKKDQNASEDKIKNGIILYIQLQEMKKVDKFIFKGNEHISEETFEKTIQHSKINWIDDNSILVIKEKLIALYKEKQYQHVEITHSFETSENGSVKVLLSIDEGLMNSIRSIQFKGNKLVSKYELKNILISRESWILGFLDRGGMYRKEMVDFDRYQIENFYHTKGFFEARVLKVTIEENEHNGMLDIVFYIDEGPQFYINTTSWINNSEVSENTIKKIISLEKGELYNRDKLKKIIEIIRFELGELGYMYPTIYYKTKVHRDTNLIDVEFIIEKGKQIYVNKITIIGNKKTYENVIRREIRFNEGDLLSTRKLAASKQAIEGLGFFKPQTGVNWNLETYNKYESDLSLYLEEAKTGRFHINLAINSGSSGGKDEQFLNEAQGSRWYDTLLTVSRIGLTVQDSNWNGKAIRYFFDLSYANTDRSLSCGMSTPWFFDYPISAGWNASYRNLIYSQFQQTTTTPNEKNQSVNFQFGYRCAPLSMTLFGISCGMDNISYTNPIIPLIRFPDNPLYQSAYNQIVVRSFQPGTITWVNFAISNDKRNHPSRATNGYKLLLEGKMAIPNQTLFKNMSNFGYTRIGAEIDWYTPLITEYDVALRIHGYAGYIYRFPNCNVPYKELFHIGGPQNVRGFLYGQIGPMLMGSSLGATKTFFFNSEIRCPITNFNGMMALIFYDGGAGWDTIYNVNQSQTTQSTNNIFENDWQSLFNTPDEVLIRNNSMQYRHSVGIGIRLTSPMPMKIDWGFKLDRNKKLGEPLQEVHISMEAEY